MLHHLFLHLVIWFISSYLTLLILQWVNFSGSLVELFTYNIIIICLLGFVGCDTGHDRPVCYTGLCAVTLETEYCRQATVNCLLRFALTKLCLDCSNITLITVHFITMGVLIYWRICQLTLIWNGNVLCEIGTWSIVYTAIYQSIGSTEMRYTKWMISMPFILLDPYWYRVIILASLI